MEMSTHHLMGRMEGAITRVELNVVEKETKSFMAVEVQCHSRVNRDCGKVQLLN